MAGFLFYEDYYKVGSMLQNPNDRVQFYEAIFERGLYGKPLGNTGNPVVDTSFLFIESLIKSNEQKRENGAKGGRPKKQKTSGFQDKNLGYENTKPVVSLNDNVNSNENVNSNANKKGNWNGNGNSNENAFSPTPSGTATPDRGGPSGVENGDDDDWEWEQY